VTSAAVVEFLRTAKAQHSKKGFKGNLGQPKHLRFDLQRKKGVNEKEERAFFCKSKRSPGGAFGPQSLGWEKRGEGIQRGGGGV